MKPRFICSVLPLALVLSMPLARGLTDTELSIGNSNTVTASSGSGAFGTGNTVSGKSIAAGEGNQANNLSGAFGHGTSADHGSLATGYSVAAAYNSLAAGQYITFSEDTTESFASGYSIAIYDAVSSGVIGYRNGINFIPWDEEAGEAPGGSLTIGSETAMTPTSVGSYFTTNKYLRSRLKNNSCGDSGQHAPRH